MITSLKKMSKFLKQKDYNKVSAIVNFMEEHGEIAPKEAETITGKSATTVRRYFKILVDIIYSVKSRLLEISPEAFLREKCNRIFSECGRRGLIYNCFYGYWDAEVV